MSVFKHSQRTKNASYTTTAPWELPGGAVDDSETKPDEANQADKEDKADDTKEEDATKKVNDVNTIEEDDDDDDFEYDYEPPVSEVDIITNTQTDNQPTDDHPTPLEPTPTSNSLNLNPNIIKYLGIFVLIASVLALMGSEFKVIKFNHPLIAIICIFLGFAMFALSFKMDSSKSIHYKDSILRASLSNHFKLIQLYTGAKDEIEVKNIGDYTPALLRELNIGMREWTKCDYNDLIVATYRNSMFFLFDTTLTDEVEKPYKIPTGAQKSNLVNLLENKSISIKSNYTRFKGQVILLPSKTDFRNPFCFDINRDLEKSIQTLTPIKSASNIEFNTFLPDFRNTPFDTISFDDSAAFVQMHWEEFSKIKKISNSEAGIACIDKYIALILGNNFDPFELDYSKSQEETNQLITAQVNWIKSMLDILIDGNIAQTSDQE